jgi:hypothetical protein
MHQRGCVQHFHNRPKLDGAGLFVGKQLRRQQQQYRPYTLPSACAQVLADIGNRAHARYRIATKLALNRGQVVAQQLENFFGSRCSR